MTHLVTKVTGLQRWYWTACRRIFDVTSNNVKDKFTRNAEYITCEKCQDTRHQKNN